MDEGESMIGVDTASTQLLGGIARFRPLAAVLVRVAAQVAKLKKFDRDPETEALVAALRKEIIAVFSEMAGTHLQIGKVYPYREGREAATWKLLEAIKDAVDPTRLVNPKSLGLD